MRRGDRVESVHAIAACISDDRGEVVHRLGDIDYPIFLRSSVKPFIAAAVVAAGAADRFGFDDAEITLISASHNGEPGHVAAARSILAKAGISETALRCGAHPPYDEAAADALRAGGQAPLPIHNNCSGKHAGLLALAKVLGAPLERYVEPQHPAQQAWIAMCARAFGLAPESLPIAVDGCGIPTVAVSLRAAALGFARVATLRGVPAADAAALERVNAAIAAKPWYIGGTGRFDSLLIEAASGAIIGKGGAEAVHCDALQNQATGLAVKVIDGGARALAPATMALLAAAGALGLDAGKKLAGFAHPELKNVAGTAVGSIEALLPPSPGPRRS